MANTSTVVNIFQKYYANDGVTALGGGTLTWYLNKTTTLASIFSDPALTVSQTNPGYILDAGGRIQGDIRFAGTLSVLIKDSFGATVRTDDDIVCVENSPSFGSWDSAATYVVGDLVKGSDVVFYISIAASNLNNNPASGASPTKWSVVLFVGIWNTNETYSINDIVRGSDGDLYYAISSQFGNDPISSGGQWGPVFDLVKDVTPQLGGDLSANSHQIQWSKGADIISATALPVIKDGNYFDVTGSSAITSINTTAVGNVIKLHFDASLVLTHQATDLILPGGANITTAAGDEAEFVEYQAGDYRCTNYTKATGTSVIVSGAGANVPRSARTSNTILAEGDRGTLVDITANTFTQTFTAAASLTSGWWCYYRNSGSGDVTLDPNSSETIDGLTTFIMYPGETRLIQSDGTNLNSIVISPFSKTFSSTGTFTKPPGYESIDVELWGGGGGGAGGAKNTQVATTGGAGGGGGAYNYKIIPKGDIGATETVTIGAGGSAGAAQSTNGGASLAGGAGGDTSFGSVFSAFGGATNGTPSGSDAVGAGGGGGLSAGSGATGGGPLPSAFGGGAGQAASTGKPSGWGGGAGGGCDQDQGNSAKDGSSSQKGGAGGGAGAATPNGQADGAAGGSQFGLSGGGGAGGISASATAAVAGGDFEGGGGGYTDSNPGNIGTDGAAGGIASGGGGGGGGETASHDSGAGGPGGDGLSIISGGT